MMKLLSTAKNYGITDRISEADKEENLDLILRRNKFEGLPFEYTQEEQKQILESAITQFQIVLLFLNCICLQCPQLVL